MNSELLLEIIKWLILFWVLYLLYRTYMGSASSWAESKREAMRGSDASTPGDSDADSSSETGGEDWFDDSGKKQGDQLKDILRKDPELAEYIKGIVNVKKDVEFWDDRDLEEIANMLGSDILDLLHAASGTIPIDIDLDSTSAVLTEAKFGPVRRRKRMTELNQIDQMSAEGWVYPIDSLPSRIRRGDATVDVRFMPVLMQKVIYILRDRSGSMAQFMTYKGKLYKRDSWARGVVFKYCLEAAKGKTKFLFRDFDSEPKALKEVLTKDGVAAFINYLINHPAPASAGTDIWAALDRAIKDIKKDSKGGAYKADILLISDCEDPSLPAPEEILKKLSGITLHIILIGTDSTTLKKIAKSYIVIN